MHSPDGISTLEFVVLSSLRTAQLMRGCTARVESSHKVIVTAQMEVAARLVVRDNDGLPGTSGDPVDYGPAAHLRDQLAKEDR